MILFINMAFTVMRLGIICALVGAIVLLFCFLLQTSEGSFNLGTTLLIIGGVIISIGLLMAFIFVISYAISYFANLI